MSHEAFNDLFICFPDYRSFKHLDGKTFQGSLLKPKMERKKTHSRVAIHLSLMIIYFIPVQQDSP
jgi:hypothetical protein